MTSRPGSAPGALAPPVTICPAGGGLPGDPAVSRHRPGSQLRQARGLRLAAVAAEVGIAPAPCRGSRPAGPPPAPATCASCSTSTTSPTPARARAFATSIIPGILQTPGYAAAAWHATSPGISHHQAGRLAALTEQRQKSSPSATCMP